MASKIAIIILAAGSSSRLGRPKQLLAYKNTTLLQNTIKEASSVENTFVIVVTGSNHDLIKTDLDSSKIKVTYNSNWESGMSSSINKGLSELLLLYPDCESCIFAVCDQPYVISKIFEDLIAEYQKTNKGIIASSYAETLGTPVLFDKKYFSNLLKLEGQEGAKKIINRFLDDAVSIPFEKGNIDIDTPEDYSDLIF
ncbi:molybdopterin-guanine dinucleotide biosynthesis protein MobA [Flavobacterium sp. Leaf82]|uniref:nucleotidyltransferase family protein n=1 Tax=unclassified Flavobacterium TaxID=196869 RepID=UPI00070078BE|nr:nucleotidyltransferase family protein [Flavobacterium sp. Leaf82]KQO20691.1 molybdopterin-guanine dinucleotide biosynthesis protein MobA [Flavobacterium sp. Leaf82]